MSTFPTVDPGYDEALRAAGVATERWAVARLRSSRTGGLSAMRRSEGLALG